MDDPIDWSLLQRHCAGDCTPAEQVALEQWAAAGPARQELVRSAEAIWARWGALRPPDADLESAWARMDARVSASPSGRQASVAALRLPRPPRHAADHRLWPGGIGGDVGHASLTRRSRLLAAHGAIAAMVVIVLGVGLTVGALWHRAPVASPGREYATAAGQRLSVTLVDGTQLTLAPASRLRVAADYGRRTTGREVELEGEAYFTVAHDATHPFAVRAHGAVARDVGTAFDVRAYPEDTGARIVVAEGAVAVTVAGGCSVGLRTGNGMRRGAPCRADARAGDVATVSETGIAIRHRADIAGLTAWTQGRLVFEDAPLSEVVRELARAFDLEITVADSSLAVTPVSGSFDQGSIDQALDDIATAVGARYDRVGRSVLIRRRAPGAIRRGGAEPGPMRTADAVHAGR